MEADNETFDRIASCIARDLRNVETGDEIFLNDRKTDLRVMSAHEREDVVAINATSHGYDYVVEVAKDDSLVEVTRMATMRASGGQIDVEMIGVVPDEIPSAEEILGKTEDEDEITVSGYDDIEAVYYLLTSHARKCRRAGFDERAESVFELSSRSRDAGDGFDEYTFEGEEYGMLYEALEYAVETDPADLHLSDEDVDRARRLYVEMGGDLPDEAEGDETGDEPAREVATDGGQELTGDVCVLCGETLTNALEIDTGVCDSCDPPIDEDDDDRDREIRTDGGTQTIADGAHATLDLFLESDNTELEEEIVFQWRSNTRARQRLAETLEGKTEMTDPESSGDGLSTLQRMESRVVIRTLEEARELLSVLDNPLKTHGAPVPEAKTIIAYQRVKRDLVGGLDERGYIVEDGEISERSETSEPSEPFEPYERRL